MFRQTVKHRLGCALIRAGLALSPEAAEHFAQREEPDGVVLLQALLMGGLPEVLRIYGSR